jgi:uncharacterized protein
MIDLSKIVAIDVHTHADGPPGSPSYQDGAEGRAYMAKYFKTSYEPKPIPEIAQYYRDRKIAAVIFTVDSEAATGKRRYPNEEVARLVAENDDILIPFASIDPHKGKLGVREARDLIQNYGVKGFKFHPSSQAFYPNDRMAYELYEVIAEHKLIALFHTGQTGVGSGMRAGGGIKLEYSRPIYLDEVAIQFPDMSIIMAHPSFPWQEEALSVCQHKPNVYIDLSGWSPKYFSQSLIRYANTLIKNKVLFGSDFPVITPDRWLKDFETIDIKPEIRPLILKDNAAKLLGLAK